MGGWAPHWHAEYGKYHVFSTFEPDFCTRMENSPPPPIGISKFRLRIFLKRGDFRWRPLLFFCFLPEFGKKQRSNFWWKPFFCFFGLHLNFDGKIVSIPDVFFFFCCSLAISPGTAFPKPHCKFLATRLFQTVLLRCGTTRCLLNQRASFLY